MPPAPEAPRARRAEFARYVANGLVATAVHYGVLTFNLHVAGLASAGLSNLIAAVFGITASFLGSRYFVFHGHAQPLAPQAVRFVALYAAIACLHGVVLYLWTDRGGLDYRAGFVLAACLQVVLSYWGNRLLVFAPR